MGPAWVIILVGSNVELAIPHTSVHRILHRGVPEFAAHLPGALDLAGFLGVPGNATSPGVIVLLASGKVWLAGDAAFQRPGEKVAYLALRPELFADSAPWSRGILVGKERWTFVVEESAVA